MLRKFLITLLLIVGTATTGFCSDLVYSLTGHKFMPVQKGNLYLDLTSITAVRDFDTEYELNVQVISLYGAFDLSEKLSVNINLPYILANQKSWGSNYRANNIGDISAGIKYQVLDQKERFADILFHLTAIVPTGISPYKIEPAHELSTGSGGYSLKPEIAISKKISNSVPFCSLFYQYNFKIDGLSYHQGSYDGESDVYLAEVEPGGEYGASIGFVHLPNKNLSLMLRFDYRGSMDSHYNWVNRADYDAGNQIFSKITAGFGYKFPSELGVFTTFSVGTSDDAPDYELGISVAF